jgi:ubiquinone/menaquinone biosynthesis C-methylase UbiE
MNVNLEDQNERYNKHVEHLKDGQNNVQKALEIAVGGDFDRMGKIEYELLKKFGLKPQDSIVDVGCGSGRLAKPLSEEHKGQYLGTDIVVDLIEHANKLVKKNHWNFEIVEGLTIPKASETTDYVCFYSVFTHLLHEQSYNYLREAYRVLKKGGKVIFSFLEFKIPSHWAIFEGNINSDNTTHLNMFMDRDAISAWAMHLNMEVEKILDGNKPQVANYKGLDSLGQSVAVLVK